MDLEASRLRQPLHWTKVSAMVCFLFAGAVLAFSLLPPTSNSQFSHTGSQTAPARH